MSKIVLLIDKIGQTVKGREGDTLLILEGDMPADQVVLFLDKSEFTKIASQFDISVRS